MITLFRTSVLLLVLPGVALAMEVPVEHTAPAERTAPAESKTAEASARHPTPSEIAAAARAGARRLGTGTPVRRRVDHALRDHLGTGALCPHCPVDGLLPPARGLEGLTEADLQPFFDIPIVLNDSVKESLRFFTETGYRVHFQRWLERSHRWMPLMHAILAEYDLPRDLVYVAMIESGFSMQAYSHASAVGPWQFMRPTAGMYDMRMDAWVDERRDPVKATHAAARYLTWLNREFEGDWYLAWAGYNGGPTRVRRNMNATGLDDYWALCEARRLPRETCGYVQKIVAAAIVHRFPERFGFDSIEPQPRFVYETVEVEGVIALESIAKILDLSADDLRALNPELRRRMTPPPIRGQAAYTLRVPPGHSEVFLARKDQLEPTRHVGQEAYVVRSGDSLWAIARRHGTTVAALSAANPTVRPQALRPGTELMVPLPPGARPPVPATRPAAPAQPTGEVVRRGGGKVEVHYTVRSGDTLWTIAQRHGATTDQLATWNRLPRRGEHVHLSVGQRLIVGHGQGAVAAADGSGRVHVLQPGETLWALSRRYGTSVDDLRALNGIDDVRSLRVGQVLVVER